MTLQVSPSGDSSYSFPEASWKHYYLAWAMFTHTLNFVPSETFSLELPGGCSSSSAAKRGVH